MGLASFTLVTARFEHIFVSLWLSRLASSLANGFVECRDSFLNQV